MINRKIFFDNIRGSLFKTLSQPQVDGIEAILDSCDRHGLFNLHHIAHVLAEVYHETGTYMLGIKETVMPSHKDKRPSDKTVISRLDKAFATGKLPWVKTVYWRDGAFGRGPIMITHWPMYEKVGRVLGVPLRQKPELALDPKIGADIAVVGLMQGLFTNKKLGDYSFPSALDLEPKLNPRRMVNGEDGTDAKVAKYHRAFYTALAAAFVEAPAPEPAPVPAAQSGTRGWFTKLLMKLFGADK